MARYVLALDQGTTSSRAIAFDRSGRPAASAQVEFRQIFPAPGHVEHDAEDIWASQLACARRAAATVGFADIAALGITNQRETTILWERDTGRPVGNAIVWQSRVSAGICERMKADGLADVFRRKTGLVLDAYFSGTKIRHRLDTVPGLRARAERGEVLFGTVDSFLIWRLTGGRVHVTDVSNASRTLLFDIRARQWDDELLRLMGVPRAMLPEVRATSEVYGLTDEAVLGAAVPIAAAVGDQQAATFGQACFAPGDAKNTYGTGCFLLLNTGETPVASSAGLLTTVGWTVRGRTAYCLEGSVFIGGAVVQWLRDGLGIISRSAEVEELAASVPDSGGVVFVPAFTGLGAPHWDPHARGLILGLTRGTTKGHIARAALESVAFQTAEVLDAMTRDAGKPLMALKADGGAARNDRLMQFQADLLGVEVRRPVVAETTALGAAYLAGLAVGFWADTADIAANWALDRSFLPAMATAERERLTARWRKAVARCRDWED